ncbi:MAG: hypothetical protein HC780_08500 [Leptolyngbyaceae cyanobacterium CSU_1_3]|nr:hypothetical protein [Leptolyngbyaceae cyanobacterium CSU_1_3]
MPASNSVQADCRETLVTNTEVTGKPLKAVSWLRTGALPLPRKSSPSSATP